jgi:hypothetical protein
MYGSETGAFNRSGRRKIEIEVMSLKPVSGYAFRDCVRNATIRDVL